ncbi:MAG TPA: Kdo hydroxylase family protein, partial [Gammaproteobacteria bacterium]|nr:Kdo hydroxylase family protein [Gammaproteobacteria bacterium]
PYQEVAKRFLPKVRRPLPLEADILYFLKITRKKRLPYDHYMLQIHDTMKGDMNYQQQVAFTPVQFPPGSTWMVYTDLVSHAALAGRYVMEQTFYPPVENMYTPEHSPHAQLQQLLRKPDAAAWVK